MPIKVQNGLPVKKILEDILPLVGEQLEKESD